MLHSKRKNFSILGLYATSSLEEDGSYTSRNLILKFKTIDKQNKRKKNKNLKLEVKQVICRRLHQSATTMLKTDEPPTYVYF